MVTCEVCGQRPAAQRSRIEGATLWACAKCLRLGTVVYTPPQRVERQKSEETFWGITTNYSNTVRTAREASRLTQEQLAQKVNESATTIARIESGKMQPTLKIAQKLEKVLRVKLIEAEVSERVEQKFTKSEGATFGDIVKVK